MIKLLKRSRLARAMAVTDAAQAAGMSHQNWSRIEQGKARTLTPGTLARMADVVGVASSELKERGHEEAAAILERIERERPTGHQQGASSRPTAEQIAAWFRDESIPIDERRRVAERFLDVLPFLMRGQEPPPAAKPAEDKRNLA